MSKQKERLFILSDGRSGESFMLSIGRKGSLTVYDTEKKIRRAIRHCPNQKSIFLDEQDQFAIVEPIIFKFGSLSVKETQPITAQFLQMHPDNEANGGHWFLEYNEGEEAKESIKYDELIIDVKAAIRAMAKEEDGIHELSAVAAVLMGSVDETLDMDKETLKRFLYNAADNNVNRFVDDEGNVTIFEDEEIKRKYITLRAMKDGVIKKSLNGRTMLWAKDNKAISTAPASVDLTDHFVNFLSSDEGMLVLDEIIKRS